MVLVVHQVLAGDEDVQYAGGVLVLHCIMEGTPIFVIVHPWRPLGRHHPVHLSAVVRGRAGPPFRATTARSVDGRAEPPWYLAEQIRLIFAGPGHVTVRPQQHGGHIQFLAAVDDVVDPVGPPGDREPAGLVEE